MPLYASFCYYSLSPELSLDQTFTDSGIDTTSLLSSENFKWESDCVLVFHILVEGFANLTPMKKKQFALRLIACASK